MTLAIDTVDGYGLCNEACHELFPKKSKASHSFLSKRLKLSIATNNGFSAILVATVICDQLWENPPCSHLVIFCEIPFQNIQLVKQPVAYSWPSYISSNKHSNLLDFI